MPVIQLSLTVDMTRSDTDRQEGPGMAEGPNQETLAQRVTRLREQMGWTKRELADKAHLHPTHIGLIERAGRVDVRYDTLEKIAGAFGVTVAFLQGKEDDGLDVDLERYRPAVQAAIAHGLEPEQLLQLINQMATMFKK